MTKTLNLKILSFIVNIIAAIIVFIALTALIATKWISYHFGSVSMDAIIFTLLNPRDGIVGNLMQKSFINNLIIIFVIALIYLLFLILLDFFQKKRKVLKYVKTICLFLCVPFAVSSIVFANNHYNFISYYLDKTQYSQIIDDNYVSVNPREVVFPEQKRNLILLVLESAENTFNDEHLFPGKLMSNLHQLQQENIHFKNHVQVSGTDWSVAGLTAMLFGLPLRIPENSYRNVMENHKRFLNGATSLIEIFEDNGYQVFISKGAHANFAGLENIFYLHSKNPHIYDWFYFKKNREDAYHDPHEWKWGDGRDSFMAADNMAYDFLTWLMQQDFYNNTTVVVSGDHLFMSEKQGLIELPPIKERTVLNLILNPITELECDNANEKIVATFDFAPTILEAVGAKLPQRKFGLGTSLFSKEPTLLDKYSVNTYESEITKRSALYNSFY